VKCYKNAGFVPLTKRKGNIVFYAEFFGMNIKIKTEVKDKIYEWS